MAFVKENIPQDVLETFDFSIFKCFHGRTLPRKLYPAKTWTRDKDRDVFLIATDAGGGAHVGAPRQVMYGLWWKGDVVYFFGEPVDSRDAECQLLTWEKSRVEIPPHLESRRAEFVALLKEALVAEGTVVNAVVPKNSTKVVVNLG